MVTEDKNNEPDYLNVIAKLINVILILLLVIVILVVINFSGINKSKHKGEKIYVEKNSNLQKSKETFEASISIDTVAINKEPNKELIKYGRELIINTSAYIGPKGKISHSANGMNCQNCHLEAGTKPYGNNYRAVASTYPKFRDRSGTIETIYKRVNDCIERSLNGSAIDTLGREMQAIVSYIKWLGKDVPKGESPLGSGLANIPFLDRAADPEKGSKVYELKCESCHEDNGEGKINTEGLGYKYPPLWGEYSYNNSAGLYRLSRFAAYVKFNMPQGASYGNEQLTNEEAWDLAAFVNSQSRPQKKFSNDWSNISRKPIDHPYGPYADNFSELQHKYGPFKPIERLRKKQ